MRRENGYDESCLRRSMGEPTMTTTLLTLTLAAVMSADPDTPRKPNPLAPSLPLLTDEEEAKIDAVIDRFIDPDVGKLRGDDYKKAVQLWETLAQVEPPDGPFAAQVRDGIAEARQLAGLPPAAASTPAPAAGPQGATLSGTVTLAPELAGRASPGDVLFVFARAVDGPRMPVAIVRKSVKDLPLAFTLDDSMAMSPENSLSSAKRVILGARISRSGNAVPRDGDLQGATPAVEVGASGVRLEIDQVVGN